MRRCVLLFLGMIVLMNGCVEYPEEGTPFHEICFSERQLFFDNNGGTIEDYVIDDFPNSRYQVTTIQDLDKNVYHANIDMVDPFIIDGVEVSIAGTCVSVKVSASNLPRKWLVYVDNKGPNYGLHHGVIEVYQRIP